MKTLLVATVVCVMTTAVCCGQNEPESIAMQVGENSPQTKETLERFLADRSEVIALLEKALEIQQQKLTLCKRGRVTGTNSWENTPKGKVPTYASEEKKAKVIVELETKVASLKAGLENPPHPIPLIFSNRLSVGNVGRLMLRESIRGSTFRVVQVIDKENALVSPPEGHPDQVWIWVSGIDTASFTDDSVVNLSGYWEVVGTKSYHTVAGSSRTVHEIRQFDITPYLIKATEVADAEREAKRIAAEAAAEKVEKLRWRKWTSTSGSTQEAKFISVSNGIVSLEKDNGQRITVRLEQLSKDDQDFIRKRKWVEESPRAKKP